MHGGVYLCPGALGGQKALDLLELEVLTGVNRVLCMMFSACAVNRWAASLAPRHLLRTDPN